MKPKHIILLAGSTATAIIFLQNTQVVSLHILFWKISMSRIILFPLVMAIGFAIGFFVGRKPYH